MAQLTDVNSALENASKTKNETDIKTAQSLLDKPTDSYLKKDKATIQEKLNALKKQIEEENAKATTGEEKQIKEQKQTVLNQESQNNETVNSTNPTTETIYTDGESQNNTYTAPSSPPTLNYTPPANNSGDSISNNSPPQDNMQNPSQGNNEPNESSGWGTTGDESPNGGYIPCDW